MLELILTIIPLVVLTLSLFVKPHYDVYKGPICFNGEEAYNYLTELCYRFKGRVVGSENDFLAGFWVANKFRSFGYQVYFQNFTTKGFYGIVKAMNVYAIKRGKLDKYIVVVAHRDIVPTTIEGANDNGAGVAVLIELAKVFSKRNLTLSIIFLCTDSEETGLHGARFFVQNFQEVDKIICAISVDMCCWKDATGLSLIAYYNPPKFSDASILLITLSLRELGYNIILDPLDEVLARSNFIFAGTDSMPFVTQGIPAIGICDYPLYPYWHKKEDTLDKVSPKRLQLVGEVVERLILTIDLMNNLPRLSYHYLIISDFYIPWYSLYLSTILTFIFVIVRIVKYMRPTRKGFLFYLLLYLLTLMNVYLLTLLCIKIESFTRSLAVMLLIYSLSIWLVMKRVRINIKDTQGVSLIAFNILYLHFLIVSPEIALVVLTPTIYVSALAKPIRKYKMILAFIISLISLGPWILILSHIFLVYGYRLSDRLLCYVIKLASYIFGFIAYIAIPAIFSLILVTITISILIILRTNHRIRNSLL